jgi:hypothetical protein
MIFPPDAAVIAGADELAGALSDEPQPLISVSNSMQNTANRRDCFTIDLQ